MKLSLIVPTYRRADCLRECLTSIFASEVSPENYEVIVVIDGICSSSLKVTEEFRGKHSNLYVYNQIPNKGPASARNFGFTKSIGEIIAFTDDDCILNKDWIGKMLEEHSKHPDIAAIGGETRVTGKCLKQIIGQYLTNMNIEFIINGKLETIFFPTCNVSIKRNVFRQEWFDQSFPLAGGEDLEYFWRLFKKGYRFRFEKNIVLYHNRPSHFRAFAKQNFNYGRGNMNVYNRHKDHPTLQNLSLESRPFIKHVCLAVTDKYENRFWDNVASALSVSFQLNTKSQQRKVKFYLLVARLFYLTGKIREFIYLKRSLNRLSTENNI